MAQREIDRYVLEREIGAGGMGQVYLATDPKLSRPVALKVLLEGHTSNPAEREALAARLVREARSAAAFQHPHAVTVYDVGEFEGNPYIAMEYIEGSPLRKRARTATLRENLRWLLQVAQALAAAHKAGIIHRDIKPDNVIISSEGIAKVVDFGIARRPSLPTTAEQETVDAGLGTLTSAGQIVGTPIYMAPEQIQANQVDGKTDQFSWGVMAYEVLSGKVPWSGGDTLQVIAQIVTATPPSLQQRVPNLPEEVSQVVMRSLARVPEQRFASLDDLVNELEPLLATVSEEARQTASHADPKHSVSTDVAMAATGKRTDSARSEGGARTRLVWVGLGLAAVLAVGALLWRGKSRADSSVTAAQALPAASPVASTPALRSPAHGLKAIADYRSPVGAAVSDLKSSTLWDAAASDFEEAARQPEAPVRWQAATEFCRAHSAYQRGELEQAVVLHRKATDLDPKWEVAWVGLGVALAARRETAEALLAVQTAQRLDPGWWVAVAAGARIQVNAGKYDEAIQEYRRALRLAPNDAVLLSEVAHIYHASRLDSEAERYARKAIEIDPDLASVRLILAERALERGDGEGALQEATRAASVAPKSASVQLALGDALLLLKRSDDAREAYKKAVSLAELTQDRSVPQTRLQQVREALTRATLPPPRAKKANRSAPTRGIGGPERSAPEGDGSGSRSAPDLEDVYVP